MIDVSSALTVEGLTEKDSTYWAIVDPAGNMAEEIAVAHEASSCMLFAAWLLGWRGQFKADTIQNTLKHLLGDTYGRIPDVNNFCDVGALLWWALSPNAPEHVDACVIAVQRTSLYSVTLTVIAGGQRTKEGLRCIARLERTVDWNENLGAWIDRANGRHVRGVSD